MNSVFRFDGRVVFVVELEFLVGEFDFGQFSLGFAEVILKDLVVFLEEGELGLLIFGSLNLLVELLFEV